MPCLKARHRDDHLGALQGLDGLLRVGGVQFRLGVQQHVGFLRLREQVRGVLRGGVDQVAADGVGGFDEVAELGAGLLGDPLGGSVQLRGLRVVARRRCPAGRRPAGRRRSRRPGVAAMALAASPASTPSKPAGAAMLLAAATATTISDSAASQSLGAAIMRLAVGIRLSSSRAVDDRQLGARLDGGAQAGRGQRVVLAQEGADDQHALQRRQFGDRHAQVRHDRAVQREVGLAQAEVDVLDAEAAHGFLQQVQFFHGRVRRCATAAMLSAPCSWRMLRRPWATYSSAVCQSVSIHLPSCLSIGLVRRVGVVQALRRRSGPCPTASTR